VTAQAQQQQQQPPQGKPHTGDLSEKVRKKNEESAASAASRGGRSRAVHKAGTNSMELWHPARDTGCDTAAPFHP
jgi:hypothetical protein